MRSYRCVINRNGVFVAVVMLRNDNQTPHAYELKDGETLLDAPLPGNMLKPRWDGTTWLEAATPEEIAAARPPEPEPVAPQPDAATVQAVMQMLVQAGVVPQAKAAALGVNLDTLPVQVSS